MAQSTLDIATEFLRARTADVLEAEELAATTQAVVDREEAEQAQRYEEERSLKQKTDFG